MGGGRLLEKLFMIRYSCPRCGAYLEAEDHCMGQKHACPKCAQRLQVPPCPPRDNRTVLGKLLATDNKTILGRPLDEAVILEFADEDDPRLQRNCRPSSFECPRCGSREKPEIRKETAGVGWILFAVLLVFFFPLCWLGIFMRETWEVCRHCGHRIHKEGPTIRFD